MPIPEKPKGVTFTDAQWQAIWASGSDLLVSAAAGSGKTKVLITRMIEKVLDEQQPIDVDQLLVVTFTNAAAAEMRHRMAEALEEAIAQRPQSVHLRRQLNLLNKAQISTLHSFCLHIVRQYAYLLDIDPGFRIADSTEAALLRDDTMSELLEEAYGSDNPEAMYRLADSFTADRNDQSIEKLISKLYDYSRVHPSPEQWLRMIPQQYEVASLQSVDELPFIDPLKLAILHTLEEALALAKEVERVAQLPEGPLPLEVTAQADQQWLTSALRIVTEGSWEEAYTYFQSLTWVKAGTIKKDSCDEELAKRAKSLRDTVKKMVNELREAYFTRTPARLLTEMTLMAPMMHTLIELVLRFSQRYEQVKIDKGIVDFSDLEHYALQILAHRTATGELVPSDIALEYRQRFEEVLVDEYQDVNLLQESIIQLVKRGGEADGNLFMVGDVKQSIYRFRLAEPLLFLGKYARFTTEGTATGLKIDLNANFRSRKEVLDATNYIFSQIMGERVGEIDYDEAAALKYGARYPEKEVSTGLSILYKDDEEEQDDEMEELLQIKSSQAEARFIIRKIKEYIASGAEVTDAFNGQKRPIEYRDIVILMRSMTWSGEMFEEFEKAGIPLHAERKDGYFEALEIMVVVNVLRIIDNPYQDIPFASVLRSPIVGLTENELAAVRLAAKNEFFYDALHQWLYSNQSALAIETEQKLHHFLRLYEQWRQLARRGSLAELIWQIYTDTHYFEMVGWMANGRQRQANLLALHDRALAYEKTSFRGLFRFLRFVDRMKRRGDDLGEVPNVTDQDNVVRMMTIHSSKGLEFPYVFVAGLGRAFNKMDFHQPYLFDPHFGLAVKAIDPDNRIMYTSLPFLALKETKELEMRAEEMRILYVAMTRAKEHLELVATVKDIEKEIGKWQEAQLLAPVDMLPGYMRSRANRYLDWIGPAVARHADFRKFGFLDGGQVRRDDSVWSIHAWPMSSLSSRDWEAEAAVTTEESQGAGHGVHEQQLADMTRRFDAVYPHEASVQKRSKQTVSELKRLALLEKQSEETGIHQASDREATSIYLHDRPLFMQQRTISAGEYGTAMHTVMQHIPLERVPSEEEVNSFVAQLVERQLLTNEEAQAVNASAIVRFFHHPLAKRIQNATRIERELPFTYAYDAGDGDYQIVQGIADCLFKEEDGWVLLDYKTDRIRQLAEATVAIEMQERYGVQLNLYKRAIEEITRLPIKEMIVYLFDGTCTVTIQEEFR